MQNGTVTLEAEVYSAVEQGHDVQEIVRQLTCRRAHWPGRPLQTRPVSRQGRVML